MKTLDIFQYENYKIYVKDWVHQQESKGRGLYKKMAENLRLSHVMISQIFNSDRQLSPEHSYSLAQFLHLSPSQRDYFMALVGFARAGTHEYRQYWQDQMSRMRTESKDLKKRLPQDHQLSDAEKARFYSHWAYTASRLASSLPELRNVENLAVRFQLPVETLQEILEFLLKTGLMVEGKEGYEMGPQRIHLEANSPYIHARQVSWRFKGMQQMNFKKSEDLFYTGPMSLSRAAQKDFRAQLVQLFEQMSSRVINEDPETLVCLNLDFFEF